MNIYIDRKRSRERVEYKGCKIAKMAVNVMTVWVIVVISRPLELIVRAPSKTISSFMFDKVIRLYQL